MCFGGGGSKAMEAEARRAREEEEKRQAEIRQGRQNINAIFDGGYVQDGPVSAPRQNNQGTGLLVRGLQNGSANAFQGINSSQPQGTGLPGPGLQNGFANALQGIKSSQPLGGLLGGVLGGLLDRLPNSSQPQGRKVEGFATDDFFNRNRQSFMDYALPQLDQQFGDASKELSFDLARGGLLNSSVRGEQGGKLQRLYDQNMQQVTNEALSREQQQRTSIEDARANLLSMLQTTGDAQGATNQALSRAAVLSQPQPFSPMGQLFTDFTAGLGTQAAMERAGAVSGGRFQPRYDTGLFGAPSNAVVNRR